MNLLEFKAVPGALTIDEKLGIVECFVAGIGNKDSVGDIIPSGAFKESFERRKPRVVWGHDWNQPIGKVLEIYEVPSTDPRLPAKMKRAGIGGLYARLQFNLKSERGREAFANVLFFGEDQEWSIGYKTIESFFDPARQANILKRVELFEVSPVLHGANQLTATISIKSDRQETKAPLPPDALPQERVTGDILRGYGPRRGNLERLLRYWRPIMKQPGGFRRCLGILADHPELYPLANICAWLHHETTGLWPNEGCHHPGMKNCRKKLRGWTDGQFADHFPGKEFSLEDDDEYNVTEEDVAYANTVLKQFCDEEKDFISHLGQEENWDHVGDDDEGMESMHPRSMGAPSGCPCGGCGKSEDDIDILEKAGRVLSGMNLNKVRQALELLEQVVQSTGVEPPEVKDGIAEANGTRLLIEADSEDLFAVKAFLDPVIDYYNLTVVVEPDGVHVRSDLSDEAMTAVKNAAFAFLDSKEGQLK